VAKSIIDTSRIIGYITSYYFPIDEKMMMICLPLKMLYRIQYSYERHLPLCIKVHQVFNIIPLLLIDRYTSNSRSQATFYIFIPVFLFSITVNILSGKPFNHYE